MTDFSYESTDPIYFESFWGWSMYDALVTWAPNGDYIGSVAYDWDISEDGNTWTFYIRDDITFHNGDHLTAYDVKFSVDRFASPESSNPWSPYLLANMRSTAVLDDYTFIYRTNTPEPPLIIPFAWTRIIPKDYFEEVGQDYFRAHPIGSGPWKFVEHIPETSFTMEAFTEHWRTVPEFKYVTMIQVPEEATRIALLTTGEVDIVDGISSDRIVEMMAEGWRAEPFGLPALYNISFSGTGLCPDCPTSDIRVRKAFSYAVNRQELCDTFYEGLARPGGRWFMHEATWGWNPDWEPDPYDPQLAMDLLEAAGYPDAFANPTIKYFVSPGPGVDLAQVMQGYWSAVGLDVQIEIIDAVEWGGYFFIRQTDPNSPAVGGIFPWNFGSVFDNIYHCANMYKSTGVHSTGWDPHADELYNEAVGTIDDDLRKARWTAFQEYVYDEMFVNCPFVIVDPLFLMSDKIGAITENQHLSLADSYAGMKHP
jgi:peptide/nickel transport system substrate-binding protein